MAVPRARGATARPTPAAFPARGVAGDREPPLPGTTRGPAEACAARPAERGSHRSSSHIRPSRPAGTCSTPSCIVTWVLQLRRRKKSGGYSEPVMAEPPSSDRPPGAALVEIDPLARELGERFRAAGHELHLVGGVVRDSLLGRLRPDAELDMATSAEPSE